MCYINLRFTYLLTYFFLECLHVYNTNSRVSRILQKDSINTLMQRMHEWKEASLDVCLLKLYQLQCFHITTSIWAVLTAVITTWIWTTFMTWPQQVWAVAVIIHAVSNKHVCKSMLISVRFLSTDEVAIAVDTTCTFKSDPDPNVQSICCNFLLVN